ncbi:hypothetical protein BCON_0239g00040 [Botryotinia convoluta]|uniref:Uncharacterized protein n=1 Tax=Botryotinia convoluta TaxID=54673 RepID=A0A4Z1HH99_9HELO|nr:hypothetical protein BCON_0239g00040 [Botryotinia convoluta]
MTTTPLLISLKNNNRRIRILTQALERKTFISRTTCSHACGTDAAIGVDGAGGEGSAGGIGHAVACAVYDVIVENVDERDDKEVVEDDDSADAEREEVVEEQMVDKVVEVNEDKDREVEIVSEIKFEEDIENSVLVDDKVENVGGNTTEEERKLPVLEVREFDEEVVDVLRDEAESEPNVVERLDEKALGEIVVVDVDTSVFKLVVADGFVDKLIEVPDD